MGTDFGADRRPFLDALPGAMSGGLPPRFHGPTPPPVSKERDE
jgi:hypothetical protein